MKQETMTRKEAAQELISFSESCSLTAKLSEAVAMAVFELSKPERDQKKVNE